MGTDLGAAPMSIAELQYRWAAEDIGVLLSRRRRRADHSGYSARETVQVDPRQLNLLRDELLSDLRPAPLSVVTVAEFYSRWIHARERQIETWQNDETVMRLHVLPALGSVALRLVRPLHIAKLIASLRLKRVKRKFADGRVRLLSSRSIHGVYGSLRSFFRDAKIEDLVEESPCILTKHQLGEKRDSDPEWRSTAIYTRSELGLLLFDARVPVDRRLLYALEGVGGLRHGEAAGLRFRNLLAAEPLGMIVIARSYQKGRTKTGDTRYMPIHPALAELLADWVSGGWAQMFGRDPTADDLLVPLEPTSRHPGAMRKKENSWRRLKNDLVALGLRHRRGHDLRRTMISLARSDGAVRDILRRGTHKPPKEVLEGYTTFEWDVLCREVSKLNVKQETQTMENTRGATRIRNEERGLSRGARILTAEMVDRIASALRLGLDAVTLPERREPIQEALLLLGAAPNGGVE